MTTIELRINGAGYRHHWRFRGPSDWAELSPRQAIGVMRFKERIGEDLTLLFPLLQLLYGLRTSQQRWLFDERFLRRKGLSADERMWALSLGQSLIDSLGWMATTEPGDSFLVPSFRLLDFQYGSASVLMKRSWYRTLYYGPASGLATSSFGEFMYAEKAYKAQDFALLAAILYRPAPPDIQGLARPGEARHSDGRASPGRAAFEPGAVDARAELFAQLDASLLSLISAQYAACKQTLMRAFPRVFSSSAATDEAPQPVSSSSASWLDVAIGLAKLDVTKIPFIERTNLYLALKVLDEQIRQADEMDEQLEAMRRKP